MCDVTSALLPPSEGAPVQGSMHMQRHMFIHRSTNTSRCALTHRMFLTCTPQPPLNTFLAFKLIIQ